jgi:hypothetical protein
MATFLSDEWFASVRAEGVGLDDTTVELLVTGAPGGDATWHVRVSEGTLVAAGGGLPAADVSLTLTYDDLVAAVRGELEPSVVFMQGRMKTAGDPGRVLDVVSATATPAYRSARDALAATTEF